MHGTLLFVSLWPPPCEVMWKQEYEALQLLHAALLHQNQQLRQDKLHLQGKLEAAQNINTIALSNSSKKQQVEIKTTTSETVR